MGETVKEHCKHKDCMYRGYSKSSRMDFCKYLMITGHSRGCGISDCNKYAKGIAKPVSTLDGLRYITKELYHMTYNEFVNKPLRLRRKVEHKIEEVRLKEAACMSATAPLQERIQNSVNNTTELAYVSYADAKRILGELLSELDAAQNELREFLYGNLHFNEADLLEWRYADGKSLHEIAELQHITYDAARTRASRAEKNARKAYNRHTQQQNVTL